MALLVRARLSLEDDDDDAATSYSRSSGASSSPPLSLSPPPPAPSPPLRARVTAQLSFSDEDSSDAFDDDSTSYGDDGELVEEVSNGVFFSVARVPPPPPPPEDPSPVPGDVTAGDAAPSVSGNLGAAEGSLEYSSSFVSSKSLLESFDAAGSRSELEGHAGVIGDVGSTGVEDSLDGSFQSSRSFVGALDDGDATTSGDFDGSVLMTGDKQGDQDFDAEACDDTVPHSVMADVGAIDSGDVHIVDALEGKERASEHEFVELPPDSAAKECTPTHDVISVEDASPEYVSSGDVDGQHSIADGELHKLDEETDGEREASDDPAFMPTPASMPTSDSGDAGELSGKELEDSLPVSHGTRFGLDDSDEVEIDGDDEEEEVDGKEFEHLDYAALAELLRAANISPGDQEDEEHDYDQLPPFKPLSKSEVAKLYKEQQELYFDEYDYRTKLLQKKQLKGQLRRIDEMKKREGNNHDAVNNDPDDEYDTYRSPMPDWTLPSSFDSDDPVYRYRCLEPSPNLLLHAVPNPDGWDHDCGFDGVSIQHSLDVVDRFPASLWVQVNKDKREFTIYLDSSVSAKHGDYGSTLAGFDIRTMMDQLAYTLRGETKFKNFKKNITTGGLSMTFLGNTIVTGAKFEDKLSVGNRLTLVANTGAVSMRGDTAYQVNMEATMRGKHYPIGQSLATLGASLVRWRKEWTMAANFESQFSVGRTSNMAVHVDVNNKLSGRVSIKASTSEQLKIALLRICSVTMYLWSKMHPGSGPNSR